MGNAAHQACVSLVHSMRADPSGASLDRGFRTVASYRHSVLRTFKRLTGTTPRHFLQAIKIDRAKRLLADTDRPITTICLDAGYESLGTFSRVFKALVGVGPLRFRSLVREMPLVSADELIAPLQRLILSDDSAQNLFGHLVTPAGYSGITFIGLFGQSIPIGPPRSGTVAFSQGRFSIPVGAKTHDGYILAAGFPLSANLCDLMMPQRIDLHIGASRVDKALSCSCHDAHPIEIVLRRTTDFDAPIVYALPVAVPDFVNPG